MNKTLTQCVCLSALISFPTSATSVFVGYGQSEQTSFVSDAELEFKPAGESAMLVLDVTDNLSVSADVYQADDNRRLATRAQGQVDIESWSIGATYFSANWSFSASFADWEDELRVVVFRDRPSAVIQQSEAPTVSLSASYDWQLTNWQLSTTVGLHRSDWEQRELRLSGDNRQSSVDEGNSTFASLSGSASYAWSMSDNRFVIAGISARWNESLSDESNAVSRNGRNISQIRNRNIRNQINAQAAVGSESYGQVNAFLSYDITQHWLVDLNTSFDFGGETTSQAWSVNLGYVF